MIQLANGVGSHGGSIGETLPISDTINSVALTGGGAAKSITVPSGAKFVLFSCPLNFYAKYTGTATVPGDVIDGSASELNPGIRRITDGDTISVIAAVTAVVTAAFYS